MNNILGLITARGASKGIPHKNLAVLGGKPLILWTIEAAQNSQTLSRCILSTDDSEIAEIGKQNGIEVPFLRPKELALDNSPHIDVVLHVLAWIEQYELALPEYVVLLQPTSPLRVAEDVDAAIDLALSRKATAVVSVVESHAHPFLTYKRNHNGTLDPFVQHDLQYLRRQDLPPAYFVNGAVYVKRINSLRSDKTFYSPGMLGYVMPEERSLQIDTPWDLQMANLILKKKQEQP